MWDSILNSLVAYRDELCAGTCQVECIVGLLVYEFNSITIQKSKGLTHTQNLAQELRITLSLYS